MDSTHLHTLKSIADGLHALGKPGRDDAYKALRRLQLMEKFERLVMSCSQADRHNLVIVLRDMLNNTTK